MVQPMRVTDIKNLIRRYERALVGLAHYDSGIKKVGCGCSYCAPIVKKEVSKVDIRRLRNRL